MATLRGKEFIGGSVRGRRPRGKSPQAAGLIERTA